MYLEKYFVSLLFPLFFFSLKAEVENLKPRYPDSIASPTNWKNESWDFSLKGNYLLWQTTQDGLDIAWDNVYVEEYSHPYRGRTYGVSFPFRSGFQIEADLNTKVGDISLRGVYSWLSPKQKENISQDPGITTFPFFSVKPTERVPNSTIFVIEHTATFQQYYNLLDLYLHRAVSFTPKLEVDFSFGIRSTWQSLNWYTDELVFTLNPITSNYLYDFTQKFAGAGPIFQIESKIFFFKDLKFLHPLAIYFKNAYSVLLGSTTVKGLLSAKSPFSFLNYFDNQTSIFSLIPVMDFSTGLYYELSLENKRYRIQQLNFDALFETQSWIGFNKMLSLIRGQKSTYNMTVIGLTLGVEMLF
jgi:hypothetical protein